MGDSWQPPQWLNDNYLEEVLKKYLQDDSVVIQSIDLKPATASGENYASVMTRIKIEYNTAKEDQLQTLSFITKASLENDPAVSSITLDYDIYNTEMKMYEHILPQMAELLKEVGVQEQLFANTLKVDHEQSTIIFEDLTAKGYVLADRMKGLDLAHAELIVKKMAKFHAAAAVLNERLNHSLEKFDRGLFNRHTNKLGLMWENFTYANANCFVKDCPSLGAPYYDKLMKLKPYVVQYATQAYVDNAKEDFLTLCHGDLWINNIMMKYNDNKELEDLLLVDFQFSNWASPAIDLYLLFTTSLEPQLTVDMQAQDKMLQLYHMVLTFMLAKLKYSGHIPSLKELRAQFEKRKFLACIGILTDHAIANSDKSDEADLLCLVGNSDKAQRFRENCCKNKRHQKVVQELLPYFDSCGLLDLKN
uniref:CHK kinase-like domain-containing protein n=1 Tax=Stomoxys calcitrans TaxID=35570 RepID=A0A1I8PHS2_STOCA